jgi:hypothetical protein
MACVRARVDLMNTKCRWNKTNVLLRIALVARTANANNSIAVDDEQIKHYWFPPSFLFKIRINVDDERRPQTAGCVIDSFAVGHSHGAGHSY